MEQFQWVLMRRTQNRDSQLCRLSSVSISRVTELHICLQFNPRDASRFHNTFSLTQSQTQQKKRSFRNLNVANAVNRCFQRSTWSINVQSTAANEPIDDFFCVTFSLIFRIHQRDIESWLWATAEKIETFFLHFKPIGILVFDFFSMFQMLTYLGVFGEQQPPIPSTSQLFVAVIFSLA